MKIGKPYGLWGFSRKSKFITTTLNKKNWLKRKVKNATAKASRKANRGL